MRWGIRKQNAAASAQCVQEDERGGKGKKGKAFSWLGKLTSGKEKPKDNAAPAFPSCLPKRSSPSPAVVAAPGRNCSDVVPRRLSVGNDSADAVATRRHCSLGGDRELPPLGHIIPFSLSGPARKKSRRRRRRRSSGNGSVSGRRSSFSVTGRVAVVRRTRDPQRAFRESMVEMIGWRPEEVERLLACYLSLNAKEHHECIVKVFRQVWFEYINLLKLQHRHCGGPPMAIGVRPQSSMQAAAEAGSSKR